MIGALVATLLFALNIFIWIMIIYIVMSWLIQFDVLNIRQPFVSQVYYGLSRFFEPIFAPIRRSLPPMGGLDLSPVVVLIAVYFLQQLLVRIPY